MHDITLTLKLKTAEGVLCRSDEVKHWSFCTTRLSTTGLLNKAKDLHGYRCSIQYSKYKPLCWVGRFLTLFTKQIWLYLELCLPSNIYQTTNFHKPFLLSLSGYGLIQDILTDIISFFGFCLLCKTFQKIRRFGSRLWFRLRLKDHLTI